MSIENMLKSYADSLREEDVKEEKLQAAIERSKDAFWESEAKGESSWLEFLYQQAAYIQKRWWLAQGLVLTVLWLALYLSGSSVYERRCMGILIPCFGILLLPEFWKNRSCNSMEVEGAAYFSLHRVYAARLILFGMADTCLLTVFCIVSAFTLQMAAMDFLIQFILPLNVTCSICFQTLQSKRNISIYSALMISMGWIMVWVSFVLNERVYEKISAPVWWGSAAASFMFLCFSIVRVWNCDFHCYEAI